VGRHWRSGHKAMPFHGTAGTRSDSCYMLHCGCLALFCKHGPTAAAQAACSVCCLALTFMLLPVDSASFAPAVLANVLFKRHQSTFRDDSYTAQKASKQPVTGCSFVLPATPDTGGNNRLQRSVIVLLPVQRASRCSVATPCATHTWHAQMYSLYNTDTARQLQGNCNMVMVMHGAHTNAAWLVCWHTTRWLVCWHTTRWP
jgi:hypothetical protein